MSYDPREAYNNPPPQQPAYTPYPLNDNGNNPNLYPPYMPYDVSQYAPDPRSQSVPWPPERPETKYQPPQGIHHATSQPHIFDAVNEAFDKSQTIPPPNNNNSIPADLIQQITEQVRSQVLNDLKANANLIPQAPPQRGPPHQPSTPIPVPQSTTAHSPLTSTSSRPVYTPPSPTRHEEDDSDDSDMKPTPEPKQRSQKEDLNGRYGDRSVQPEERSRPRPPMGDRSRTYEEETTLEKIWQPLFDPDGQPTNRLAQFLCGLALHLIEDYEPKKSLVIPPHKMLRFYDEVSLPNEPYPWRDLFTKLKHDTLSRIYRSLGCNHHFIQETPNSQPSVPALTPGGFCQLLTLLIQAHPETEFQRLAMVVRDMPISNADDRRERFPKELSRRLFPKHHNSDIRHRTAAALLPPPPPGGPPRMSSMSEAMPPMPPPPPQATAGANNMRSSPPTVSLGSAPPPGAYPERERTPYAASVPGSTSTAPTDNLPFRQNSASTDGSAGAGPTSVMSNSAAYEGTAPLERLTSLPIERERKPYIAKEGMGKIYEQSNGRAAGSEATLKPPSAAEAIKRESTEKMMRRRSNSSSFSTNMPPPPLNATRPHNSSLSTSFTLGPPPTSANAGAAAASPGLRRSDSTKSKSSRSTRARSPDSSVGNGYASAPNTATYGGSQVYSGSEDDDYAARREREEDERRERRKEKEREERRERDKEREREKEREKDRERDDRRDREREYERRERERDKYREPDRDRDSDRSERRDREREKDYNRQVEREREIAEKEYRRQAELRERFDDDNYSTGSGHSHHRRSTTTGSNGYGPPPMGGAAARGGY